MGCYGHAMNGTFRAYAIERDRLFPIPPGDVQFSKRTRLELGCPGLLLGQVSYGNHGVSPSCRLLAKGLIPPVTWYGIKRKIA
jgi:hypothetical protein